MQYTGRFTGKAADYAQYRERYEPSIILPFLRERCGLKPEWSIADIGAGTGMVGDLFRAAGCRVFAVEPNAEMRAACASLHADDDEFTVIDGTAEKTGLPDKSIDMIGVGRALHWFHIEPTLIEFKRILKPGGWVAVLTCGRSEEIREENFAFKRLMQLHTGRDRFRENLVDVYERLPSFFMGGIFHHAEVPGEMHLDWEQLRGLTLSISHAPLPQSAGFAEFESELRQYFERFARNGRITLATCTWMNAGQFAAG